MLIDFLTGFGILISYFIVCATGALLLRRFVKVPKEVFRKTLHLILLGSLLVFVYAFNSWWVSVLANIVLIALLFPVLTFAERRITCYSELLTERKNGEIKSSLVIVFGMYAAIIAICWGWLYQQWLVLACVYAWGFGDAAAALIGKRYGKHGLEGRFIEGRKSVEGTLAMFVVSFFSVLVILLANGKVEWYGYAPIAALTAAVCAAVELYTPNGMDTLTCPFAAAVVILPLVHLWGI